MLIVASSCRKELDFEFPDYPKLPVINCILSADSLINAHISLTDKQNDYPIGIIDNALVTINPGVGQGDTLVYQDEGLYFSKIYVIPGQEYICSLTVPDISTIVCSTFIPQKPKILDLKYLGVQNKISGGDVDFTISGFAEIQISFLTDQVESEYFELLLNSEHTKHNNCDPVFVNEGIPYALFSNELATSDTFNINLQFPAGPLMNMIQSFNESDSIAKNIFVELRKVNKDYYTYFKDLYFYLQGRYPGFGNGQLPVQLYSNIKEGMGIFAGYSSTVSDTLNFIYK
ncbi:MAG: DUF4249 family protein [Bacteroidales bacterium]|nr:DUF4249 family protein [Bacteroidales bacterium]